MASDSLKAMLAVEQGLYLVSHANKTPDAAASVALDGVLWSEVDHEKGHLTQSQTLQGNGSCGIRRLVRMRNEVKTLLYCKHRLQAV